ncbi:MAG: hypothetical protein Q8K50_12230 [Hydrogenophaga sp.]|nr:hypothetical protein [Hydrogenophaga sp.]
MNKSIPKRLESPFKEFESDGELKVNFNFSDGQYSNDSFKYKAAKLWLEHKNNERIDTFNLNVLHLSERQVMAAEKQAHFAVWAVVISVFALIFSAAPYFRG